MSIAVIEDLSTSSLLVVETEERGRGVVANRDFQPGELIEPCPVLIIPAAEWPAMEKSILYHYGYAFGADGEDMAIALGYGSLYNHSYTPNAMYQRRLEQGIIDFVAIRHIHRGEEITVNYNGDPDDQDPVWFEVR